MIWQLLSCYHTNVSENFVSIKSDYSGFLFEFLNFSVFIFGLGLGLGAGAGAGALSWANSAP